MVNSLLRQWPASSLSAGEMKAVATVCGTAIAFYSHWQFAPKWLSPLIVTNLKVLALQLGDSPKFLVYKGLWPHHMILEVCWDSLGTLSFGLSQFHGHGSWLVCEVALNTILNVVETGPRLAGWAHAWTGYLWPLPKWWVCPRSSKFRPQARLLVWREVHEPQFHQLVQ